MYIPLEDFTAQELTSNLAVVEPNGFMAVFVVIGTLVFFYGLFIGLAARSKERKFALNNYDKYKLFVVEEAKKKL